MQLYSFQMVIAIHLFNSLYFVWKNGIASYPFVLFQACVNPWNKNFAPSMSEVMPIGKKNLLLDLLIDCNGRGGTNFNLKVILDSCFLIPINLLMPLYTKVGQIKYQEKSKLYFIDQTMVILYLIAYVFCNAKLFFFLRY